VKWTWNGFTNGWWTRTNIWFCYMRRQKTARSFHHLEHPAASSTIVERMNMGWDLGIIIINTINPWYSRLRWIWTDCAELERNIHHNPHSHSHYQPQPLQLFKRGESHKDYKRQISQLFHGELAAAFTIFIIFPAKATSENVHKNRREFKRAQTLWLWEIGRKQNLGICIEICHFSKERIEKLHQYHNLKCGYVKQENIRIPQYISLFQTLRYRCNMF
jgi:hypothetical protein